MTDMTSTNLSQAKANALEAIKNYRVAELQILLDHGHVPRQGTKRDLLHRCQLLIASNFTQQLANKIHQINNNRKRALRSQNVSSTTSSSIAASSRSNPIVLPVSPPIEVLPQASHIQFVNLPFYEKMRTIDCSNMPVDWHSFNPIRFLLNETDLALIRKNSAKVFLRIAPTIVNEKHNDVLPRHLFVQCNNQGVVSNSVAKQIGAQAHSIAFPTDITDKIILRANATNTLTFFWLERLTDSQLKNLPKSYTLTIQLVHCVSVDTLFNLIIKREPYSTKRDDDSDIEVEDLGLMTTQHRVSLICPITQSLIVVPAKSAYCSHLNCFDLRTFLQMNERKLQWACPLCKKSASFESLRVDERLQKAISNVPPNCSSVELDAEFNCQYILDSVKQEKLEVTDMAHLERNNQINSMHDSSAKSQQQSDDSDCIVLSSGSESEDEETNDNNDNDEDINDSSSRTSSKYNQNNDIDRRLLNEINDDRSQKSNHSNATPSPIISTTGDNYWEDFAQITYDLSPETSEKNSNRKRTSSSTSSVLSPSSSLSSTVSSSKSNDNNNAHHHHRKKLKRTSPVEPKTGPIEVITLSSSDDSDNDEA